MSTLREQLVYVSLLSGGKGVLLLVDAHRRARADEVSIAVDVVHAADRRPVLGLDQRRQRVHGLLAAVGVVPVADQLQGGVRGVYDKHHLVPFGEYVPFRSWLPFLDIIAGPADFVAGTQNRPLSVPGVGQVQMLICYEVIFAGRVIDRQNRPDVMVNVTNDGWFQESEGSLQHFRNALFRSIELRRPTIRCANRGVTGVVTLAGSLVDPYSKKMRHLVNESGSYFHRGYLLATVYIPSEGEITLYAAFGDWFAVSGLIAGFLWVVASFFSKKSKIEKREG